MLQTLNAKKFKKSEIIEVIEYKGHESQSQAIVFCSENKRNINKDTISDESTKIK